MPEPPQWTNSAGMRYELTPTVILVARQAFAASSSPRWRSGKVNDAVKGVACREGNGD